MKKKIILLATTLTLLFDTTINAFASDLNSLNNIYDEKINITYEEDTIIVSNQTQGYLFEMDYRDEYVYSTDYLNVRTRPTTESKIQDTVVPGHVFYRVGHSDYGWDMILDGEEFFFVYNTYLTEDAPYLTINYTEISDNDYYCAIEASYTEETEGYYYVEETEPYTEEIYEKTEVYVEETQSSEETSKEVETHYSSAEYSPSDFKYQGVIYWGDWRWTYYSERVLPGPGLNIPGRYTDSNGYVCDENDYICLASSELSNGTILSTPFGKDGKIYDCGCPYGTIDVYTSW